MATEQKTEAVYNALLSIVCPYCKGWGSYTVHPNFDEGTIQLQCGDCGAVDVTPETVYTWISA